MVPAGPIELAAQKLLLGGGEEHVCMRILHLAVDDEHQQVVLSPVIREIRGAGVPIWVMDLVPPPLEPLRVPAGLELGEK